MIVKTNCYFTSKMINAIKSSGLKHIYDVKGPQTVSQYSVIGCEARELEGMITTECYMLIPRNLLALPTVCRV